MAAASSSTLALSSSRLGCEELVELYRQMALMRRFEEEAECQYELVRIGGYCHVSIGKIAERAVGSAGTERTTVHRWFTRKRTACSRPALKALEP